MHAPRQELFIDIEWPGPFGCTAAYTHTPVNNPHTQRLIIRRSAETRERAFARTHTRSRQRSVKAPSKQTFRRPIHLFSAYFHFSPHNSKNTHSFNTFCNICNIGTPFFTQCHYLSARAPEPAPIISRSSPNGGN